MKSFLGLIGGALVVCLLYLLIVRQIGNSLKAEENKYKIQVGKKVIIGKDTLQILDYSIWQENFTLSNGSTVSYDFVEKQLLTK